MAVTFVVSHQRAVVIPFGAPDYLAHAINYGVLAALFVWAFAGGQLSKMTTALILPAAALAIAFGLSDEFHQSFIPGRDASLLDVLADAVGAVAGACAAAVIGLARRRV